MKKVTIRKNKLTALIITMCIIIQMLSCIPVLAEVITINDNSIEIDWNNGNTDATLITAGYDENGVLSGINIESVLLSNGIQSQPLPDVSGVSTKIMLWDSIYGMRPLCEAPLRGASTKYDTLTINLKNQSAKMVSSLSVQYRENENTVYISAPNDDEIKTLLIVEGTDLTNISPSDIIAIDQASEINAVRVPPYLDIDRNYTVLMGGTSGNIYHGSFGAGERYIVGDVNINYDVKWNDASAIVQYDIGNQELFETSLIAADCNFDGKVNSRDALENLKYLTVGSNGSIGTVLTEQEYQNRIDKNQEINTISSVAKLTQDKTKSLGTKIVFDITYEGFDSLKSLSAYIPINKEAMKDVDVELALSGAVAQWAYDEKNERIAISYADFDGCNSNGKVATVTLTLSDTNYTNKLELSDFIVTTGNDEKISMATSVESVGFVPEYVTPTPSPTPSLKPTSPYPSSYKIGILTSAYTKADGSNAVLLYTSDAKRVEYVVEDETYDECRKCVAEATIAGDEGAVVLYTLDDSGQTLDFLDVFDAERELGLYDEDYGRIGNIEFSESTPILFVSENGTNKTVESITINHLIANCEYEVYAYSPTSSGLYRFIVITEGEKLDNPPINYPYEIFDISFEDEGGNYLNIAPEDSGFLTRINFWENKERMSEDCVILAVYGENNALLSLNYMKSDFDTKKEYSVAFYIPKQSVKISSVKAFIWTSLDSLQPLCEPVEVSSITEPTITLSAYDINYTMSDADRGVIYFYIQNDNGQSNSVKYTLTNGAKYYVNGVDKGIFDNNALNTYIVKNPSAEVKLQKEAAVGSLCTYTKYNAVMITTYETAVVNKVIKKSDCITIEFKDFSVGEDHSIDIYVDNNDYSYSFILDGNKINPIELKENDILTIAYKGEAFKDSNFYDIQVSRATVEGKCIGIAASRDEYTIGNKKYRLVDDMSFNVPNMSEEYKCYLDVFGKIAYLEKL